MLETLLSFSPSGNWPAGSGLASLGVIFVIGALTFIPRPPICIVGGLLFGFAAFPVALVGSTFGAVVAFLLSRYLFRSRFSDIADRRPRLRLIVDAIDAEGWRLLGLLRLASPVPGSASNYLFGLTGMGLWPYVTATFVGSAPQVLAYVYLGMAGRMALDPESVSNAKLVFTLTGCALLLFAIFLVTRRVKSIVAVKLAHRAGSTPS
jgi:uncharacterized membrane protein YdjX (TVP38/TMEM64 family)